MIYSTNGTLLYEYKWDVTIHGDEIEKMLWFYLKSRNIQGLKSNGLVIGSHDGRNGHWIYPIKNGISQATLIEGSEQQFKKLSENYKNLTNIKLLNEIITTNDNFPELVHLFNEPYDINVGRFLYDQDPWLHPLRFHENVLNEFKLRKGLQDDKNKTYIDILELFCKWDQIMSYAKINDGSGMNIAIELISYVPYYLKEYPKKKKKEDAKKAWDKIRPNIEVVLKALEWQKKSPEWFKQGGQFIPYPATWIRSHSWEDQPVSVTF